MRSSRLRKNRGANVARIESRHRRKAVPAQVVATPVEPGRPVPVEFRTVGFEVEVEPEFPSGTMLPRGLDRVLYYDQQNCVRLVRVEDGAHQFVIRANGSTYRTAPFRFDTGDRLVLRVSWLDGYASVRRRGREVSRTRRIVGQSWLGVVEALDIGSTFHGTVFRPVAFA